MATGLFEGSESNFARLREKDRLAASLSEHHSTYFMNVIILYIEMAPAKISRIPEECVKFDDCRIDMSMNNFYRPIPDFAGYRVSRDGEVQSCWVRRGRYRLPIDNWFRLTPIIRDGYLTVNLPKKGGKAIRRIHRLVLEMFVGPCPAGHIACHRNGDRLNNALTNLYWGTHQTISDDAVRHGTKARGERLHSKLTEAEVVQIRRLRTEGQSMRVIADRFEVSESNVRAIVRGRTWRHLLPTEQPETLVADRPGLRRAVA